MRLCGKTMAVVGGSAQGGAVTPYQPSDAPDPTEPWGRAISKRLALEGASVVVVDPHEAWVARACDEIAAAGGRCTGIVADIADYAALTAIADRLRGEIGSLDALVTCYLDIDWRSIEQADIAAFERVMTFNTVGPVKATKAFLPLLKQADGAAIVHVGSVDGLLGAPGVPSYSASKGALVPLTHIMAYEFADYDIRVNMIASCATVELPEAYLAKVSAAYSGFPGRDYMRQLNAATPLKRHGPMTDWAGAVVFLVSPDAAYVTGAVLVVDCGRTMITPGTQFDCGDRGG